MTDTTLDQLRALHDAATPAPWAIGPGGHRISAGYEIVCGAFNEYGCGPRDDVALIAAMRNALPLLLAVVDAADALLNSGGVDTFNDEGDAAYNDLADALKALLPVPEAQR